MSQGAVNVVQLSQVSQRSQTSKKRQLMERSYNALPDNVKKLHQLSLDKVSPAFITMFDKADNFFYELADRSESNQEQNQYLDAMREIRLKRERVTESFRSIWQNKFAELKSDGLSSSDHSGAISIDSLSLMAEDEMEEKVALNTMVSKVKGELTVTLIHLNMRLGSLLIGQQLESARNPFTPQTICEAFVESCSDLSLEITAKIHLYKLFEQHVVVLIPELVRMVNEQLIQIGILPDLSVAKDGYQAQRAAHHTPQANDAQREQPQRDELFQLLRETFEQNRYSHQGAAPTSAGQLVQLGSEKGASSGVPQQVISQPELINVLSQMQSSLHYAPDLQVEVMPTLQKMLVQHAGSGNTAHRVGQGDHDVINLVAMLFEFILNDENLPDVMGAQLGRLQIPFIKVAIEDADFFNSNNHPARKLLNTLASAAVGWNGDEDRAGKLLLEKISNIVVRIIDEYQSGQALFASLLDDFIAFLEKEKRRVELVEQRTRDAEEGRGKSEQAKEKVNALLSHIVNEGLPEVIQGFISNTWNRVLFLTLVRDGECSESFQEAVSASKELAWSVVPKAKAERQKLMVLVPGLLQKLNEGMVTIGYNPEKARHFIDQLEMIHLDVMKSEPEPIESLGLDNEVIEEKEVLLPTANSTGKQVDISGTSSYQAEVVNTTVSKKIEDTKTIDDQYLKLVAKLTMGTWCEIKDKEGDSIRCKLVAMIKSTGCYIFVNRSGMKVAEKTKEQLAEAMRDENVVILDDSQLFDRALESVIANLRQSKAS